MYFCASQSEMQTLAGNQIWKVKRFKMYLIIRLLRFTDFYFQIIPSQMEVAPLHCTVDIRQKRRLFKNTKEIEKM